MMLTTASGRLERGARVRKARLRLLQAARRRRRRQADHPGKVVAEIVLQRIFIEIEALRRLMAEHLQQAQPHARLVRRRIRAEQYLVLRQHLRELDDARSEE